jgi:hypothetical protein
LDAVEGMLAERVFGRGAIGLVRHGGYARYRG